MRKKLNFTHERTNRVFEKRDWNEFFDLMKNTASEIYNAMDVNKESANKIIRKVFQEILGIDESMSQRDVKKVMKRRSSKAMIYEVIEEVLPNMLVTGWQENPYFREFVEFKSGSLGDTNSYYVEDESVLTVSEVSGNHHDLIRQKLGEGTEFRVKTSWFGIKIYAEFEHFINGGIDWATFIQKVYKAFDLKVNAILYDKFMSAGDKVLPDGRFTLNIPIVDDEKDKIIQLVSDISTLTGEEACIIGTKVALSKLSRLVETNWVSEDMKKERNSTGRIGIWEGIKLIEIPQAFAPNSTTDRLTHDNRLLIMGVGENKPVKLYDEGEAQITETTDQATNVDRTVEYEYMQKMGVAVVINKVFGQIKITE